VPKTIHTIISLRFDGGDVIPRYQVSLLGSLADMELLTLQHGRVMPHATCENFKRSYLVYRSSLNWLATENLKLKNADFICDQKFTSCLI